MLLIFYRKIGLKATEIANKCGKSNRFSCKVVSFIWRYLKRVLDFLNSYGWDKKKKRLIRYYNEITSNDKWVTGILNAKRNGYFIEAGANNGVRGSSTYTLEKFFGWKGILVEPIGDYFIELKENRPNSKCVNKLLSGADGVKTFVYFPDFSPYSCTKDQFVKNKDKIICAYNKKVDLKVVEKDIECITFTKLLEENNCPKIIDYLCLDIEGCECEVLETFPFDKYKIRCISVEDSDCDQLLISKGYKKVDNRHNIIGPWESNFIYEF